MVIGRMNNKKYSVCKVRTIMSPGVLSYRFDDVQLSLSVTIIINKFLNSVLDSDTTRLVLHTSTTDVRRRIPLR